MKKIGLLLLALIFALGTLGVGYAMWSDTIFVKGTVNTGTVDIDVTGYSGTWVYKDLENHTEVRHTGYAEDDQFANDTQYELIAWAVAGPGAEDDSVEVTFSNLFPLDCGDGSYCADIDFIYEGSVPAHFADDGWVIGGDNDDVFYALEEAGMIYFQGVVEGEEIADIGDLQMHQGDTGNVKMCIQIPQNPDDMPELSQDALSGKSFTFEFDIIAHQWNEDYPCEPE